MARKGGKSIPEDWEKYSNMGSLVVGTRFVPFKVPLKGALLRSLSTSVDAFDVRSALKQQPNLGLVIDLTNTDRYYEPAEFLDKNVLHRKLPTFGHAVPKDVIVHQFFQAVDDFLRSNASNNKTIGVHCTHGINRTGYMIVRYMIQRQNVKPDEAVAAFNLARGHALERQNYLTDLRKASWPNYS